jgi:hypothetical protein
MCLFCVAVCSEAERRVAAGLLPEYASDARACFASYGYAFVPLIGQEFARRFLREMTSLIKTSDTAVKQPLTSGGFQYLLPATPDAEAPPYTGTAHEWLDNEPAAAHGQLSLCDAWEELGKRLALHVGAVKPEEAHLYHMQDNKVRYAASTVARFWKSP